jgi:hypothetical protein
MSPKFWICAVIINDGLAAYCALTLEVVRVKIEAIAANAFMACFDGMGK